MDLKTFNQIFVHYAFCGCRRDLISYRTKTVHTVQNSLLAVLSVTAQIVCLLVRLQSQFFAGLKIFVIPPSLEGWHVMSGNGGHSQRFIILRSDKTAVSGTFTEEQLV